MRSLRWRALGGEVELHTFGPASSLRATAAWIASLHRRLTRFDPASELSRLNARAGEWVDVAPELRELLVASLDAYEESGGLVNVAVLPALIAAGYDRSWDDLPITRHARPLAEGSPMRPLPQTLELRPGQARLAPGTAIDLGGIAKGWIADRAVDRLAGNALVSCCGDLFAGGGGADGAGWPVGFGGRTLLLRDLGAATSGTARSWGAGLHHVIDPRTGLPAVTDLAEVSVLARTALDAEVLAKSALILGSGTAASFLEPRSSGWYLT